MAISVNTPVSTKVHEVHPSQNKRTRWTRQSLATAFLLVFLVYFLLPFFWLIVSTTKTNPDLFTSFGLWFASNFNLFNNLSDLFTHDGGVFLTWLWNTVFYATCSAVGAALIATMAGYAFAKFQFPGRTLVFAIILGSIMVPGTALVIPTYLLLSKIGLINTPLAVILPSLTSPFGVFLMRIYAEQAVPDELLDAARVDGAGEIRIFWSVALRILVPGFVNGPAVLVCGNMEQLFPAFAGLERTRLLPTHPGFGIVERPGEREWRCPTALYPGADRIAAIYSSFDRSFSLLAKILAGWADARQRTIMKRGIA